MIIVEVIFFKIRRNIYVKYVLQWVGLEPMSAKFNIRITRIVIGFSHCATDSAAAVCSIDLYYTYHLTHRPIYIAYMKQTLYWPSIVITFKEFIRYPCFQIIITVLVITDESHRPIGLYISRYQAILKHSDQLGLRGLKML